MLSLWMLPCFCCLLVHALGFGNFQPLQNVINLNQHQMNYLNSITINEWIEFTQTGTETVNKQKRLEENMLNSNIKVHTGSVSHIQLLDSLPNVAAQQDGKIALEILKSSLHVYNAKCAPRRISGSDCEAFLQQIPLPKNSELQLKCQKVVNQFRDGHHAFRRLLPRKYKDGFYEMFSNEVTAPREISSKLFEKKSNSNDLDEADRNLALMQWTQFIEHDLSKAVVSSMGDGAPIECCNSENYKLAPRYRHPACAPLLKTDLGNKYGRETCLNYVRSALTVGNNCNFGAVEQLNQATGYLDLSQLYGYTKKAQERMRLYKKGQLLATFGTELKYQLLPLTPNEHGNFCAHFNPNNNESFPCFMAGNSRVNSNPFSVAIYTVFLKNHNQWAQRLFNENPTWNDEKIFDTAKSINIQIYRQIVYQEWLPEVLGEPLEYTFNSQKHSTEKNYQISNEFATAAIRFYLSMMPDELQSLNKTEINNNVSSSTNLFLLKDHFYKPLPEYSSNKLDMVLESLLNQRAMKMDAVFVESLTSTNQGNSRPVRTDKLAFDIQRGRDHGVRGYVEYLEVCSKVSIHNWVDLQQFIRSEDLLKLQDIYGNWKDIDLIVGGLAEIPRNGGVVGPTFACILSEQFSKMRQWHEEMVDQTMTMDEILPSNFLNMTAADIYCLNSDLNHVPTNIFRLASEKNPMMQCSDIVQRI